MFLLRPAFVKLFAMGFSEFRIHLYSYWTIIRVFIQVVPKANVTCKELRWVIINVPVCSFDSSPIQLRFLFLSLVEAAGSFYPLTVRSDRWHDTARKCPAFLLPIYKLAQRLQKQALLLLKPFEAHIYGLECCGNMCDVQQSPCTPILRRKHPFKLGLDKRWTRSSLWLFSLSNRFFPNSWRKST